MRANYSTDFILLPSLEHNLGTVTSDSEIQLNWRALEIIALKNVVWHSYENTLLLCISNLLLVCE